jgi:hypothetical protein
VSERTDMTLESLLRSTLKAEALSLPVSVVPADILRRRVLLRRQRVSRRLRLLLIAALIALPLGALAVGALRPVPSPEGYSAVLVRGVGESELQILVANGGVSERVHDVPASRFGAIEVGRVLEASASGWIALHAADPPEIAPIREEYVVLFDVSRPDAAPIIREGTFLGVWTPDGLYWSATNTAYELIDPVSGNIISLPRSVSADLDWWLTSNAGRMSVATDGFGLLLGDSDNVVHDEEGLPYLQKWGVLSPEGTLSRGLPDLAEGVGTRRISARWGLLQRCGDGTSGYNCPGLRTGAIISGPASDGSSRQWGGDPPSHDHAIDESWAVDGGLWLLVDRRSGERTIVVIHRDEDNVDREVASFIVDLDESITIGDLAPDDSLIALELSGRFPDVQTVIVETSTGRSHLFDGAFGGFVPAAATVGWVAGETTPEAGQPLPRPAAGGESGLAYGPLPPLQGHIDDIEFWGAERILLVHEVEATSPDPGPIVQLTLGPVEPEEGIGISLACSGPGHITLTEIGPDGPEAPSTYRCLSPRNNHGHEGPNVRWESATVQVDYDPSTTWRLIIYDPPPHTPRP